MSDIEVSVTIGASPEAIWSVITDIENASRNISGIEKVEILQTPPDGIVGLKWRETRKFGGKTATEDMWITEAVENRHYVARAESHGFVYTSVLRITPTDGGSTLTMTHRSEPRSLLAKVLARPMGWMLRSTLEKALRKDLEDIETAVENRQSQAPA